MRTALFLCLICSIPFAAAAESVLLSAEMERLNHEGSASLFNMNYTGAKTNFEAMIALEPKHPAGYIYLANAMWLDHLASIRRLQTSVYNRNDAFFSQTEDEVDPKREKEFRSMIEKGIRLTEQRLSADQDDVIGLYYLGIARNLIAAFEATVKRSFYSAIRSGSKGVGLHRKLLARNPSLVDAELSVGMYNYVVGSLPFMVKVLAFLGGVRGSKKDGIRQLEHVAKDGNYARDEASVLLIMLYDREKRYEDSLRVLQEQVGKYPSNYIYRLQVGSSLVRLGRFRQSFQVYDSLLSDSAAYAYMPDLIHFKYAESLQDAQYWEKAYEQYKMAHQSPKAQPALISMAHLGAGQCLDALSRRQEAMNEYKLVLGQKAALDSHDLARKYLKKPYSPEDKD